MRSMRRRRMTRKMRRTRTRRRRRRRRRLRRKSRRRSNIAVVLYTAVQINGFTHFVFKPDSLYSVH